MTVRLSVRVMACLALTCIPTVGTARAAGPLTTLVKDINAGAPSSMPGIDANVAPQYAVLGAFGFFPATEPATGTELWRTDGTVMGTVLVKDIRPGAGSSIPRGLISVNGTLFFWADE